MDETLNAGFFVVHTGWVIFNAIGWAWRRTRRWHLAAVLLTAISWFGLGAWFGWGYCVCTDWHWHVRQRLGYQNDPHSYMQLLFTEIAGVDPGAFWADTLTGALFATSCLLTVVLNVRDVRRQ